MARSLKSNKASAMNGREAGCPTPEGKARQGRKCQPFKRNEIMIQMGFNPFMSKIVTLKFFCMKFMYFT